MSKKLAETLFAMFVLTPIALLIVWLLVSGIEAQVARWGPPFTTPAGDCVERGKS